MTRPNKQISEQRFGLWQDSWRSRGRATKGIEVARATKYEDQKLNVLQAIQEQAERHARPPSVRDLAEEIGVGVATMHSYLTKMAEEGLVEWRARHHRSLRCTPQGDSLLSTSQAARSA